MAHARQQIRTAIATALGSIAEVGDNVFTGHVYPVERLPALVITTPSDVIDTEQSSFSNDCYELIIEVRVLAAAVDDGVDDLLDTIAAAVQATLAADDTLGGKVLRLHVEATEIEMEREGEQPTGLAMMRGTCLYFIDPADPETLTT